MQKITLFYLDGCPYCRNARTALAELAAENPAYGHIDVDWVEESRNMEMAEQYDYYFVPTIYAGDKKLYEANPSEDFAQCKKNVKAALDAVLS